MQWWCSASGQPWTWAWRAYPGMWVVVAVLAFAYWRFTRDGVHTGRWTAGWIGIVLIWLSIDWPLGPLGTGYIASAHALQFVIMALTAPPLIVRGMAPHARRWFPEGTRGERVVAFLTQPVFAGVFFTIVVIFTHVPRVVDQWMLSQVGTFAIDMLWVVAGLLFWWPVFVDVPVRVHFPTLVKLLYIFLGTLVHTGVAIVMLMAMFPIYGIYELAPPTGWFSPIDDLEVAGGVMELGGAAVVFGIMTVMFFRWANQQER